VWDVNFDTDTNVVDVAIRRLRAKIDDPFREKSIHTVRGMGYVLDPARGRDDIGGKDRESGGELR
jgi:DNA-binding response OmpR family regulator